MIKVQLQVGHISHPGRVRHRNEDAVCAYQPTDHQWQATKGAFFAVADGVGGRRIGHIASQYALERALSHYYYSSAATLPEALEQAIHEANADLCAVGNLNAAYQGLSTTLVAAVLRGHELVVANVGDSRAYLLRDRLLWPITRDHSWTAEAVNQGLLTHAEARQHPWRKVITRALGNQPFVQVDLFRVRLRPHDVFLLCSDGLVELVSDTEIAHILRLPPTTAAHRLVDQANQRGGTDNITALVTRVLAPPSPTVAPISPLPGTWRITPRASAPVWLILACLIGGMTGSLGILLTLLRWL